MRRQDAIKEVEFFSVSYYGYINKCTVTRRKSRGLLGIDHTRRGAGNRLFIFLVVSLSCLNNHHDQRHFLACPFFQPAVEYNTGGRSPSGITSADFNRDGKNQDDLLEP